MAGNIFNNMAISSRRISLNIFVIKAFTLIINLLIVSVSAEFFGLSINRDIWVITSGFIVNINNSFFNPISDVFKIKFIQIKEEESLHSALVKTGSLLVIYILFIIILIIIFFFFGKSIIQNLFSVGDLFLNRYYTYINILLYSILFTQFSSIGIGILNANNIFYVPEITAFFTSIGNLVIIYFGTKYVGVVSLYLGQYFNLITLSVIIIFFLKKNKILPIIRWDNKFVLKAKDFIWFGTPFYFPYFIGQINSLIEKGLSNRIGIGIISMIDYAQKFTLLFQVVFTNIILTAIIPQLTKNYYRKEWDVYNHSFYSYLKFIVFILSFFVPLLYINAYEINYIFFKRGAITSSDIEQITHLTKLYSLSFIFICLYVYISPVMISQTKNKLQALLGVITQIGIIIFNCLFYKIYNQSIFPISMGIFHLITFFIMIYLINIRNKNKIFIYIIKSIVILFLLIIMAEIINIFIISDNIYISLLLKIGIMTIIILTTSPFIGINVIVYVNMILSRWKLKI